MNSDAIKKLFDQVKRGKLSPDEAVQRLKHLPFEDLGFANVDHHRTLRVGMPEVIFGPGKSPQQFADIFARLAQHGHNVLATRVSAEQFRAVRRKFRKAELHELARAVTLTQDQNHLRQRDDHRGLRGHGRYSGRGGSRRHRADHGQRSAALVRRRSRGHPSTAGAPRGVDAGPRRDRLRWHGRRAAQRCRRTGRRARYRRADQRRLWRFVPGHRCAAGNAELLRVECQRGEH